MPRPVRGVILWYEALTGSWPGYGDFAPLRTAPDRDCFAFRHLLPRVAALFIIALVALTGTTAAPGTSSQVAADSPASQALSATPVPDHRTLRAEAQAAVISVSRRLQLRSGTSADQSPFILACGAVALPAATVERHEQVRHLPLPDPVYRSSHAPRAPPLVLVERRIVA